MDQDFARDAEESPPFRLPPTCDSLAKRTKQKQKSFLQAIKQKQLLFFARQQNKFMKTTGQDGGAREDEASLRQITLSRSTLFDCFRGQPQQPDLRETRVNSFQFKQLENSMTDTLVDQYETRRTQLLSLPNANQDMWLKYLLTNLQLLEERWAIQLSHWLLDVEDQFNTNKFRGALFYLNFHASEKSRYLKKLKKLKKNDKFIRESEQMGRVFARGGDQGTLRRSMAQLVTDRESIRSDSDFDETVEGSFLIND